MILSYISFELIMLETSGLCPFKAIDVFLKKGQIDDSEVLICVCMYVYVYRGLTGAGHSGPVPQILWFA